MELSSGHPLWTASCDPHLDEWRSMYSIVFAHKDSCMRVAVNNNGDALSFDVGDMAGGRVYIVPN
ncbi:hypothetical protein AC579_6906 [Pseudocercospora musae]|uniref:Uncharacterized protein n=1 Tax=Pseudocercospora musae TaxID=113226 RepID=A0A139IGE2_9PEZI|nr:hypothetical protein AC579_6906 [Pseudocercospora musae]